MALAGRPLYEHSLAALRAAASIEWVVIAVPPGAEAQFVSGDDVRVVAGGAERSDSVAAALAAAGGEIVVIHDAARPLLWPELVDELVAKLEASPEADGVIAAARVTDTIKRAEGERIAETPLRSELWAAQTPQVFRLGPLREALSDAAARAGATDEASLVEAAGGTVLLHEVTRPNLKVTTPADLALADLLLRQRGQTL